MPASKLIIRQRVEQVMKIRLLGALLPDIRNYAQEDDPETGRPWNVSDRTLARYVEQSDKLIAESFEPDRPKLFTRGIIQREALFARAMESGDLRTALAIADSRDRLLGLFPDKPVEIRERTVHVSIYQQILRSATDDELNLLAKLAQRAEEFTRGADGDDRHETDDSPVDNDSAGTGPPFLPCLRGPHGNS